MTCKDCAFATRRSAFMRCQNHGLDTMENAVICSEFRQKTQTNGDRIRAMSEEELADWLVNKVMAVGCPRKASECISNCKMCWTYWLTQTVIPADKENKE